MEQQRECVCVCVCEREREGVRTTRHHPEGRDSPGGHESFCDFSSGSDRSLREASSPLCSGGTRAMKRERERERKREREREASERTTRQA